MSVLTEIKHKLKGTKRERMFRETCFGHWLDIPFTDGDPHLVHLILQTQIDVDAHNEYMSLKYHVGGHDVQFGRQEFCLITGLLFGELDWSLYGSGDIPFRHRVFGDVKTDMVHLQDVRYVFDSDRFRALSDLDAVRVCLVMCLEFVFNGRDDLRSAVDSEVLRLVEDLEAWNTFPWGTHVWMTTYSQLRNAIATRRVKHLAVVPPKVPKYSLTGFIWAFKIWILETFPVAGCWWMRDNRVIPRAIGWQKTVPFQKQHHHLFFEYVDDDHLPRHPLVPRADESVTRWWIASMRFFDGLVDYIPPPAKRARFSSAPIQTDTTMPRPEGIRSHVTLEERVLALERVEKANGDLLRKIHLEIQLLKKRVSTVEDKVEGLIQQK